MGAFDSDKLLPLQLGPGYPIIGRTGSEFTCKATSSKGVIAFHFNDNYLREVLSGTNGVGNYNFNISRPKFDHHLLQLFRLAHQEVIEDHPDVNYVEHLLAASIIRTLSVYADITKEKQRKVPSARLERAEEYVRSNLHMSLRLHDLAKIAGMSQFHFARSFKAYFGMPPYKFIQRLRLEKSLEILAKKKDRLKEYLRNWGFPRLVILARFLRDIRACLQAPTASCMLKSIVDRSYLNVHFALKLAPFGRARCWMLDTRLWMLECISQLWPVSRIKYPLSFG